MEQKNRYDVIIVGAGPAGIFTALELAKTDPSKKILILEKGRPIQNRICMKRKTGKCAHCKPCNITTGFAGAGAYSDGKLSLSPDVGGDLIEYLGRERTEELIHYVDDIYLSYGADKKTYGQENPELIDEIRSKAIRSNLRLLENPLRHIGTDQSYAIYQQIEKDLLRLGVTLLFRNPVTDLIIDNNTVRGVTADKEYYAERVVLAVGREGSAWLDEIAEKYQIETQTGPVDIGVRVEVRNEVMDTVNRVMYEGKFIYYTPTFDDRVRTFCQNPSGIVATEYYDDHGMSASSQTFKSGLAVVNGHSYKEESKRSNNTNFAILVSNYFTKPFHNPIEYGKYIAGLGNMLAGDRIIVQRYGDFRRGRRTTFERLERNNIQPTLKDAQPGDLSLVIPYRIMQDIKEMIEALDTIVPGVASSETLLYGVEVKFYSNQIRCGKDFQTAIRGLYVAGDGAGITRGLMQSSANGVQIARTLLGN